MKMLILTLFAILLPYQLTQAASQTLICQQNARDIRIEFYVESEKVKLFVLNPLGYSYFNFLDQPVSEANLVNLKYQAEKLKPLGDSFWVEWSKKDCRIQLQKPLKETMIECTQKAVASSTDRLEFLNLNVSTLTDRSFSGTLNSLRFRTVVSTQGEYGSDFFFIGIPVFETSCISL